MRGWWCGWVVRPVRLSLSLALAAVQNQHTTLQAGSQGLDPDTVYCTTKLGYVYRMGGTDIASGGRRWLDQSNLGRNVLEPACIIPLIDNRSVWACFRHTFWGCRPVRFFLADLGWDPRRGPNAAFVCTFSDASVPFRAVPGRSGPSLVGKVFACALVLVCGRRDMYKPRCGSHCWGRAGRAGWGGVGWRGGLFLK